MAGISLSAVSFIVTCMGRLEHLQQSAPRLAALAPARTLVVDYGCPDGAGDWVEAQLPTLDVVRVRAVRQFNLAAARNAGAARATSHWLAFIDADVLLDASFAALLTTLDDGDGFYVGERAPPSLRGTVLCPRAWFERIGGYDEIIQGWGSEDTDLYSRLQLAGCERRYFDVSVLSGIAHDDALRARHYGGVDPLRSVRVNAYYMYAKLDLMKLTGRELPRAAREALRARVVAQVEAALDDGSGGAMEVPVARQPLSEQWEIQASLRYRLVRRPSR